MRRSPNTLNRVRNRSRARPRFRGEDCPKGTCFNRSRARPWFPWTGLVLALLTAASCTRSSDTGDVDPGRDPRPPVDLRAEVDRAEANVWDPIFFRVTLEAAPGVSVSLPQVGPMIQGFRILDMGTEGPMKREGRMWSQEWFKLQADRTGSYLLPALQAVYTEPDDTEGVAETPQIFVEIVSVLDPEGRETDIRDLKPLAEFPRRFPWAWVLGAAGLLAAAGALTAWVVLGRRKRREAVRLVLPDERARKELADMEATGILEEGRYRQYVFGLSLIFRRFLECRYGIAAVEQTSEEIMAHLRAGPSMQEDLKKMTRSFLEETDPIKYRGLAPGVEETETLRGRLLGFLDRSGPPEGVPPGAPGRVETPGAADPGSRKHHARPHLQPGG